MAKFKKKIVSTGVKKVGRLDGREEAEAITPDRTRKWAENTKKLIELGVKIPAPSAHQDKDKKLAYPVIMGKDGETLADAYSGLNQDIPAAWDVANLNKGFWESFEVDADGSLIGVVEAPGEVDNSSTPAGQLGKTIKETSILVMPERTVVDKDGNEHLVGEHIAHVAVCLHPQEPGQLNFEPTSSLPESLAMSFILKMDEITGLPDPNKPKDEELYTVIQLMRSAKNLAIPEDTTRENFLQVLKIVLTQSLADERANEQEEGFNQRPQDSQVKSPSIAMSKTTQPDTKVTPSTTEVILMNMLTTNKRKSLRKRAEALVASGRTSKEWAEKNLFPKIDAFKMNSADVKEGSEDVSAGLLDELIGGMEQATPLVGPSVFNDDSWSGGDAPAGSSEETKPQDIVVGTGEDFPDSAMDAVLDSMTF